MQVDIGIVGKSNNLNTLFEYVLPFDKHSYTCIYNQQLKCNKTQVVNKNGTTTCLLDDDNVRVKFLSKIQ